MKRPATYILYVYISCATMIYAGDLAIDGDLIVHSNLTANGVFYAADSAIFDGNVTVKRGPGPFSCRLKFISDSGGSTDVLYTVYGMLYYNNSRIWHKDNDGTGSHLDADLLDGLDSSHFATGTPVYAESDPMSLHTSGGSVDGEVSFQSVVRCKEVFADTDNQNKIMIGGGSQWDNGAFLELGGDDLSYSDVSSGSAQIMLKDNNADFSIRDREGWNVRLQVEDDSTIVNGSLVADHVIADSFIGEGSGLIILPQGGLSMGTFTNGLPQ